MEPINFTAFALDGELDLNRLAVRLNIARKYRWEEPMRLNPVTYTPTLDGDSLQVYLYSFGALVFVNGSDDLVARFLDGISQYADSLKDRPQLPFREEYQLEIDPLRPPAFSNDSAVVQQYSQACQEIICLVLAQSVALERIEERTDAVLDEVEGLIAQLKRGKLELPDRDLARLASIVLGFKYASLAQIMVLDKPDITWDNADAERFYLTLAGLFELRPRYLEIKHKSETLLDVNAVFTNLSHARRSARLEWIIILLIAFEIIMTLWEKFWGG
ncbi:MAG: RMD1 family protein [Trichlorobacter sp.]|jgi:uncharacterized Rmd1/YagE family protein